MAENPVHAVGARVARARKRRGLTQAGLAQRSSYSRSHIAGVESSRRVPTPAFVAAVSEALGVDSAELYGQPYRANRHDDHVHAVIPELRRSLVYVDIGPELEGPPRSLEVLAAEVTNTRELIAEAKLTKVGTRLPGLVEELAYWAHETDDPKVWALLSRALRDGVSLTRRLGYNGDALALLGYAASTAARAEDPHPLALVALAQALVLMGMNQYRPALLLLDRAVSTVDTTRPGGGELAGAVELRSAIVSARAIRGGDSDQAWDYFGRAADRVKAGKLGPPLHGLEFTTANVAIHGAAVAVELGDLDEAARRDQRIGEETLATLPPERRVHHEIDMAQMLARTDDYARAEQRLGQADRIGPEMLMFHPTARLVVTHLVDVRRTLPEPLRRINARMTA